VIRSAVAYGAGVWHHPTTQKVKGIARNLATIQSQCLRVVSSAYRATPVRFLEVETAMLPLDLYLNKWVADFEQRLERTGKGTLIRGICNQVAVRLQQRRQAQRQRQRVAAAPPPPRPSLEHGEGRTSWATSWSEGKDPEEILWVHWKRRWMQHPSEPPDRRPAPAPALLRPTFSYDALKKHHGLRKHESSLLTQIRTGKVGLRAFLFERKVPEVATPRCSCGEAPETAAHLVLDCQDLAQQREELRRTMAPRAMRTYRDFAAATARKKSAHKLVRWLLTTGRFPEYRLAERYRAETVQGALAVAAEAVRRANAAHY
jgi:hypothetical protein